MLAAWLLGLGLSACAPEESAADDPPAAPPTVVGNGSCHPDAFWRGRLIGAVEASMDWPAKHLSCAGGPRPDGAGARLRFARELDDGEGLAIILALPTLEPGQLGTELPANVTIIVEGEARFFSSQNRDTCWADVEAHATLDAGSTLVQGRVYCIDPLAEVNGDASVTLDDSIFSGQIDWSPR